MTPQEKIKQYLDKRASEDALFRKNYEKPNKSIDECWKYIVGEIADRCIKNGERACGETSEEIFGMAVHYYDEDKIEIKEIQGPVFASSSSSSEKLSPEEKEKAHKEAIEEYKKCCQEEYKDTRIKNASASLELTEEEKEEAKRRAKQAYEKRCIEMAKQDERERAAKRAAKKNAPEGEIGSLFG